MTGLARWRSSMTVWSLPRWCFVIRRPKITVSLSGRPIVRLASNRRSPSSSNPARRLKMRLSQYSVCVGEVEIFDDGLELAAVVFRDPTTEDHGQLVRPADRAVGL